jgi:hypothetical protein
MNGFSLYETLRFLIPGALAAAILSVTTRLATGSGPLLGQGPASSVIDTLAGGTFLTTALVLGFLLYIVDLPTRARIYTEGDPKNGKVLPSATLRRLLNEANARNSAFLSKRSLSLYFLLSDAHLPPELHRKVYFFGGLYRIYTDARILAMLALAIGPCVGLVVVGDGQLGPTVAWTQVLPLLVCVLFPVLAGVSSELGHAAASIRAHKNDPTMPRYRKRLLTGIREVSGITCVVFVLEVAGWLLCGQGAVGPRVIGLALAISAMVLWCFFEMGPPPVNSSALLIRSLSLRKLGCVPTERTQFAPAQRAGVDLALIVASLLGAATLTAEQGRSPWALLLWGGFAAVATLIVVTRKHEVRLLNSYADQSTWLELNRGKIDAMARDASTQTTWS